MRKILEISALMAIFGLTLLVMSAFARTYSYSAVNSTNSTNATLGCTADAEWTQLVVFPTNSSNDLQDGDQGGTATVWMYVGGAWTDYATTLDMANPTPLLIHGNYDQMRVATADQTTSNFVVYSRQWTEGHGAK